MIGLLCFAVAVLASPFKSKIRLEAENATLRHQLVVLRRQLKGRARLTNNDRWFFVQLYRWFPSILPVLMIFRPETLVRWHRAGFGRYRRWKSRRPGRATADRGRIARADPAGEHGEFALACAAHPRRTAEARVELAQAKYMVKHRRPPSRGWRTLLRNHAPDIRRSGLHVR